MCIFVTQLFRHDKHVPSHHSSVCINYTKSCRIRSFGRVCLNSGAHMYWLLTCCTYPLLPLNLLLGGTYVGKIPDENKLKYGI